jgi:tetratricopeptide (TPR) repeat protein
MQWRQDASCKSLSIVLTLARTAVLEGPGHAHNWLTLGQTLVQFGRPQEAAGCLTEAVEKFPNVMKLRLALAHVEFALGELDAALRDVTAYLTRSPSDRNGRILLFEVLVKSKQWRAAEAMIDDIARIAPLHRLLLDVRARVSTAEVLLSACDETLSRYPAHTNATYIKAHALADLGRADEARALMSLDAFTDVSDLAVPDGYENAEAFLAALAEEIRGNPTLVPDPRGKATLDGLQTRSLRQPEAPAVEALIRQIQCAVDVYEQRLADRPDGFASARPRTARVKAWAVVYGAEGRQQAHRHPSGWLSGVFYVAAPRDASNRPFRGSLVLGASGADRGDIKPWGVRHIEPVPGRIVLFPSYVPHATEPTGIEGARISVAFDVLPLDSLAGGALDTERHLS